MKLDPVFIVKENSLFFVDGSAADISKCETLSLEDFLQKDILSSDFFVVQVNHSAIELDDDVYNEEILASFREKLLLCDEQKKYVFINPVSEKDLSAAVAFESFTNTFNHTVRRVKDCVSVAGFCLPENLLSAGLNLSAVKEFIAVIAKKHAQFVYLASKEEVEKCGALQEIQSLPVCVM